MQHGNLLHLSICVLLIKNVVQQNAEEAVRDMLFDIAQQFSGERQNGMVVLYADDMMDDGAEIKLKITIDPSKRTAKFDFSGSSYELYGLLSYQLSRVALNILQRKS